MKLSELLNGMEYSILNGEDNIEFNKIQYDSRKVEKGDIFFCIKGFNTDGHNFISSAIQKGAVAIVCEKEINSIPSNCVVLKVLNGRKALAQASSNFFGNPSKKLKLIGITGTNGKTTSSFMIKSILEEAGYKVGLIGTIANYIGNKKINTQRTTPESLELHELFKEMIDEKVEYCIMEVSSHSLSLNRVYGLKFSQAIFTNLTQDHLDFHKTFENYYNAKLQLFKNSINSIVNIDDIYGERIIKDTTNSKTTYGISSKADVMAKNILIHSRGVEFQLSYKGKLENIELALPGNYNVYNALGSAIVCLNEGISIDAVKKGLKRAEVPGRCEIVTKDYNLGFEVIVDYAHTPDGLKKILETAREFTKGRLISVFGCGGDRDKTKRPIMGKIGTDLSDIAIITSDNPRTEEPMKIIGDIIEGISKKNYEVIVDRRKAIKKSMEIAEKGDIVVVAGKGHEDYQVLRDKTIHFDEREVVFDIVKELF